MYKEIWVKIEGYDDYYISDHGRVMSTKFNKIRYLTSCPSTHGYLKVMLCKNGIVKTKFIHRLIAEYFIPNPNNLPQVDHIDGNRQNNNINNLRWVTNQQNHFNETKAKGYTWDKKRKKWYARIMIDGKKKFLGYYNNEQEAREAYLAAKEKYHIID